jgi:hypothetical protein
MIAVVGWVFVIIVVILALAVFGVISLFRRGR